MNYLKVAVLAVEVPRGLMDRIAGIKLQHTNCLALATNPTQIYINAFEQEKLGWEWEEKQVN